MFRIELLPAAHGDAIWIEYGDARRPRRILIDGGPAPSYEAGLRRRLGRRGDAELVVDLFVVTHIDADHIDGAIILLREADRLGVRLKEVWFNAWPQLVRDEPEPLKPVQGEFLGALLQTATHLQEAWNTRTGGGPVLVPDEGPLPVFDLPEGGRITLLSPGRREIRRLRARWSSALREFAPGDTEEALRRLDERREYRPPAAPPVFSGRTFGDDRTPANGSSIAFVLEAEGKACLFAGDAHARVLAASLRRLAAERNPGRPAPVRLDAVKLPHHGSLANVSEELLAAVDCPRWLVSTSGAVFGHPDRETAELVARRSAAAPQFFCNYASDTTRRFADDRTPARWLTSYPGQGAEEGPAGGIALDLAPDRAPGRTRRPARQPRKQSAGKTPRSRR